jgi:segregation and condensation protein B
LSIAAYRQPLTRPELEEIRGVDSGSALKTLLEKGLLKILGRKEEPGRPLIYGTSPQFLNFFGLKSLRELPTLKEFTELSDESKTLFARKTGESIESIGDIEIDPFSDEEEDASEPGALTGEDGDEGGGIEERVLDLPEADGDEEE